MPAKLQKKRRTHVTLAKAIERGDWHIITTALKSGKVWIKKQK
jgi:hypothetical protein